jgi:hypothetical protein
LELVLESEMPVAVWLCDADAADRLPDSPHLIAVGEDPGVIERFGDRSLLWPDGIDAERSLPVAPFVRARWRRRWGLPQRLVWSPGELDPRPSDEVNRTAFALASAVAVTGRSVIEAMAWAAPVATDAATAAAIGAVEGTDVVVAERSALGRAAARLADDPRLAATVSRGGRRLVERRHDTARPAGVLASRLGLRTEPTDPAERVAACLDDLWTPAEAHIRLRAEGHALARSAR